MATAKQRYNMLVSGVAAGLCAMFAMGVLLKVGENTNYAWPLAIVGAAVSGIVLFLYFTRKFTRRKKVVNSPFPLKWRDILGKHVAFYNALEPAERTRFENEVQVFLQEVRVTGIKTKLTDVDRVLVAASAVIPIFGFPDWEYDDLGEVLVYPQNFNADFKMGTDENVLGMVGTGVMNKVMILSKPALYHGFGNANDRKNTAVHEFAHLVDKADGSIDGLPAAYLDPRYVDPWLKLMERKMADIRAGISDIRPYGATNTQEFFAVVTEYFFESPALLEERHPDLFRLLKKIFHQDLSDRLTGAIKSMITPYGRQIGRNDPCPCGSGKKYKKCCLD